MFGGSSNTLDFLPLDRTGNRRFVPVMVYPERAEVHILDNEEESRAYIHQMWAEAMAIYRSGDFKLRFSPTMNEYLKAHQREFMPEDTKAGQILDYLESYTGNAVCSKQLYREALGHEYDEPKQWELREINDIMNNVVKGWKSFSNPRHFPKPYLRQKGWERELPTTEKLTTETEDLFLSPMRSLNRWNCRRDGDRKLLSCCRLVAEPVVNPVVGQNPKKPCQDRTFLSLTTLTTKISKKK